MATSLSTHTVGRPAQPVVSLNKKKKERKALNCHPTRWPVDRERHTDRSRTNNKGGALCCSVANCHTTIQYSIPPMPATNIPPEVIKVNEREQVFGFPVSTDTVTLGLASLVTVIECVLLSGYRTLDKHIRT